MRQERPGSGELIYGVNPVLEALKAGTPVERIYVASGARGQGRRRLLALARQHRVPVQSVPRIRLDRWVPGAAHQGVVALAAAAAYVPLETVLQRAQGRAEPPFLLLLDGVEDPGNLGAILRSAEAGGVHGVVIPRHRCAGLVPSVVKASAGAVFHVPVTRVRNLAQTIGQLRELGVRVVGGEPGAAASIYDTDLTGPLALVVGGEGRGLRRLVAASCDALAAIPLAGRVGSLNVSVAAGVMIFEALRQRCAARQRRERGAEEGPP